MNANINILKNRNFLLYWLSGWITSLGDSIFVIALTWMLIEKTSSPAIVGTYLFILGVSKMVFILVGGVIVDRFDAKKLIISSNVLRAFIIFGLFFMGFTDFFGVWVFYVIGAIFGMVDAVAEPAMISCRTRIVEEEHYTQSMSLLMVAGNVSAIIGPMIGAGLVALGNTQIAIVINAFTFLVSAALLMIVSFKAEEEREVMRTSMIRDMKDGFSYFISTPIILTMAVFAFFSNAAVGATVVSIPFLSNHLGFGVEGFGYMNTGIGVGSAIGAILFSIFTIRNPKPYMTLLTCFLQGIVILLIGFTHNLWLIVLLFALMGLYETAVNVIAPSVNHTIIPKNIFGRVISIMILVMSSSVPISQAAAGWAMEWVQPETIFVVGGLIQMAAAAITFSFPFVRAYDKKHHNAVM